MIRAYLIPQQLSQSNPNVQVDTLFEYVAEHIDSTGVYHGRTLTKQEEEKIYAEYLRQVNTPPKESDAGNQTNNIISYVGAVLIGVTSIRSYFKKGKWKSHVTVPNKNTMESLEAALDITMPRSLFKRIRGLFLSTAINAFCGYVTIHLLLECLNHLTNKNKQPID